MKLIRIFLWTCAGLSAATLSRADVSTDIRDAQKRWPAERQVASVQDRSGQDSAAQDAVLKCRYEIEATVKKSHVKDVQDVTLRLELKRKGDDQTDEKHLNKPLNGQKLSLRAELRTKTKLHVELTLNDRDGIDLGHASASLSFDKPGKFDLSFKHDSDEAVKASCELSLP